jgi:hypothetical protein
MSNCCEHAHELAGLGATALDVREPGTSVVHPLEDRSASRLKSGGSRCVELARVHPAGAPGPHGISVRSRTTRARLADARAVAVAGRMHRGGSEALAPLAIALTVGARARADGAATSGVAARTGCTGTAPRAATALASSGRAGTATVALGATNACRAQGSSGCAGAAGTQCSSRHAGSGGARATPGSTCAADALRSSSSVGQPNASIRRAAESGVAGAVLVASRAFGSLGLLFLFRAAAHEGARATRQQHSRPTPHQSLREAHVAEGFMNGVTLQAAQVGQRQSVCDVHRCSAREARS